jgi:hypothetical protein
MDMLGLVIDEGKIKLSSGKKGATNAYQSRCGN